MAGDDAWHDKLTTKISNRTALGGSVHLNPSDDTIHDLKMSIAMNLSAYIIDDVCIGEPHLRYDLS
jgi:hypothetical protein